LQLLSIRATLVVRAPHGGAHGKTSNNAKGTSISPSPQGEGGAERRVRGERSPPKPTHGGRRPGAGAPGANMNAFKHGLSSAKYDQRLLEASSGNERAVLAHMRDLVYIYHHQELSRRERERLIQQAGLTVLTTWHGLCHALLEEQSR